MAANGNGKSATERREERIAKRREKMDSKPSTANLAPDAAFEKAAKLARNAAKEMYAVNKAWYVGDIDTTGELLSALAPENRKLQDALSAMATAHKAMQGK